MERLHRLAISASVLAAIAAGCSSQKRPASATTETTSATWTTENRLQEENTRLQKERDDARAALLDERADHARDLERFNADNTQRREHDELEMRALEALTVADVQAETLRNKAKNAGASARKSIEDALSEVQDGKAKLRSQLQRLHADTAGAAFESLKSDIESTIADLDRATASATTERKSKQRSPPKQ